jgi:hypothetical protein
LKTLRELLKTKLFNPRLSPTPEKGLSKRELKATSQGGEEA